MTRRLDWHAIKDRIPIEAIEAVARSLLGEPPGRGGARGLWWPCPLHADRNPSFLVDPERGSWKCFGCGERGDAADLLMRLDGLAFPEAVKRLASMFGLDGDPDSRAAPPRPRTPPPRERPEAPAVDPSLALARGQWAKGVALEAVERLWSPEGREALAYLRDRGLTDEAIRRARLGFVASLEVPRKGGGTYRASGVSVPWFDGDRLALLKVRQMGESVPKYVEAFRDRPSLHALFEVRPGLPLVIVEGEFDAILLGQELGGLANVATAGSASSRPTREALNAVRRSPRLCAAHDADAAGDKAASLWPSRAIRVRPPAPFKDWGELHQADPAAIRRIWSPILRPEGPSSETTAKPEPVEEVEPAPVEYPRPEDFATLPPISAEDLAEAEREAREERLAIMRADGIEGDPEPAPSPGRWLAELNRLMGRENPPGLLEALEEMEGGEAGPIERVGPSLPQGGFEPDEDDEAARLAMFAEGEPEAVEGEAFASFEGMVADLFDARRIAVETGTGSALPAPPRPEAKPWRQALAGWSIDRREAWGRLANRLIGDGQSWRESERLAFEQVPSEPEPRAKRPKPKLERPAPLVAGTLF